MHYYFEVLNTFSLGNELVMFKRLNYTEGSEQIQF